MWGYWLGIGALGIRDWLGWVKGEIGRGFNIEIRVFGDSGLGFNIGIRVFGDSVLGFESEGDSCLLGIGVG